MKILCLHPWGTSARIFEQQLSGICKVLGEAHEYVFIDGPISCGPAKGLPATIEGPFYNWYDGLSSVRVKAAHEFVKEVIEDEGPFDGVIGFSQGASLALSLLYDHEINHPSETPPFRFAVFICAVLSISPDLHFNAEVIKKYSRYYKGIVQEDDGSSSEQEEETATTTRANAAQGHGNHTFKHLTHNHRAILLLPGQKRALAKDIIGLVRQLVESGADQDGAGRKQWNTRGGDEGFPRVYHPLINKTRISIPTVHVVGRSDPLRRQSEVQTRLCRKDRARVIEAQGGHKVTGSMVDLQAIATAVDWAIRIAQLG